MHPCSVGEEKRKSRLVRWRQWACHSTPSRRCSSAPRLGLCWIMQGGGLRGLWGLEAGMWGGESSFYLGAAEASSNGRVLWPPARSYWKGEMHLEVGFGVLLKCESLSLRIPFSPLSAPTRPLRPDVSRGGHFPSQPFIGCRCARAGVCRGCRWRPASLFSASLQCRVLENHAHAHSCRIFTKGRGGALVPVAQHQ